MYVKVGIELKKNTLEALQLVRSLMNIKRKEMYDEIFQEYLISYAKKKGISDEIIKMIEKKLASE